MEKIIFDYSKLKGRIIEKVGSQKAFAKLLGITEATMTSKMNCDSYFTQVEIMKAIDILGIQLDEVFLYFFTLKVQNIEL